MGMLRNLPSEGAPIGLRHPVLGLDELVGGDPADCVPLDSEWRIRQADLAVSLGMMFMACGYDLISLYISLELMALTFYLAVLLVTPMAAKNVQCAATA